MCQWIDTVDYLPKSKSVHEFGFASPDGIFPYFFSAKSLILDLQWTHKKIISLRTTGKHTINHFHKGGKSQSWSPYPMASICGRENAVAMMKNRVQYTRGFTKRTLISAAFTSLATLAISTATTDIAGTCELLQTSY